MEIAKKLLVCGLSLALISSVGAQGASAHHVHVHRHYRISRVMKRHHQKRQRFIHYKYRRHALKLNSAKQKHYLSFSQLIKVMNYDTNISHNNKYHSLIVNTLYHNKNQYSTNQLDQILTNKDADMWEGYPFSPKLYEELVKQVFHRTDDLKYEINQGSSFNNQIRANLINDINKTRIEHGLNPLKVTNTMQDGANFRKSNVQYAYEHLNNYKNYPDNTSNPTENWVHGVDTHTSFGDYLHYHGFSSLQFGSNAGTWFTGNHNYNQDGTPINHNNTTPQGVAYNINNNIVNHDMAQGNNNEHRKIELSPKWKYVGVGITYDPNAQYGTFNEQFSSDMNL